MLRRLSSCHKTVTKQWQSRAIWATVCKTDGPMLSVRCPVCLSVCPSVCLSCLSVAFVHCGQTVGWIKMKLGMGPHPTQCGQGRGLYLRAKFHLDPSNRLATEHQRYRQDSLDRTDRQDRETDNGLIAWREPFCKRSAKNGSPIGPLSVLSVCVSVCLSVCNVGVVWPNGWMDQDVI